MVMRTAFCDSFSSSILFPYFPEVVSSILIDKLISIIEHSLWQIYTHVGSLSIPTKIGKPPNPEVNETLINSVI
jgi:hypothetical protein